MYVDKLIVTVMCFVVAEQRRIPRGCSKSSAKDVCNGDLPGIPELSSRDSAVMITKKTSHWKYCDVYAIRKQRWYKSLRSMTTNCPSMYMCGTKFPIWLKGTNPEPHEGIVNMTSCVKSFDSCCVLTYKLVALNCEDFMAYCLIDLPSGCHQRYCFEKRSVNSTRDGSFSTITTTTWSSQLSLANEKMSSPVQREPQLMSGNGYEKAIKEEKQVDENNDTSHLLMAMMGLMTAVIIVLTFLIVRQRRIGTVADKQLANAKAKVKF